MLDEGNIIDSIMDTDNLVNENSKRKPLKAQEGSTMGT